MKSSPPIIPSDLKFSNRRQIVNVFFQGGPLSLSELASKTGLSRQTIAKSVQFFLENNVLESVGKGVSTNIGGKRPELYALSSSQYFLIVTIWMSIFSIQIRTLANGLIDELVLTQSPPDSAEIQAENIGKLSYMLLEKNNIKIEDVRGLCISTGGIVDYKNGILRYNAQASNWGTDIPLRDLVQQYFPPSVHILIENAVKIGANPYLIDPTIGDERILVISSGRGVAGCLIANHTVQNGRNSLIGEIGHTTLDPNSSVLCPCGGRGCFSRMIGVTLLTEMIHERENEFPDSPLHALAQKGLNVPDIFRASNQNDPLANELVTYLASCFAVVLRNVSLTFDPECVILQGDYANANSLFLETLRKHLHVFRYYPNKDPFRIVCEPRSLDELNDYGAYIALLRNCLDNSALFPASDEITFQEAD